MMTIASRARSRVLLHKPASLVYGTVSYLRLQDDEHKVHCAFVMGKARVVPLKPVTIPRLELTAATMAVRKDVMLQSELELSLMPSVYWTDSTSVLKYMKN